MKEIFEPIQPKNCGEVLTVYWDTHTHTHESILNLTIEHKLFSNSVDALNTKLLPAGSRHWFRSCGCLTKTVVVVEKSTVADPKKKKYNTPVVQQF